MRVDVEEIYGMECRRRQINGAKLADIEFYMNGRKLAFDPNAIDDFRFVGLSNIDFIVTAYQSMTDEATGKPCYAPNPLNDYPQTENGGCVFVLTPEESAEFLKKDNSPLSPALIEAIRRNIDIFRNKTP